MVRTTATSTRDSETVWKLLRAIVRKSPPLMSTVLMDLLVHAELEGSRFVIFTVSWRDQRARRYVSQYMSDFVFGNRFDAGHVIYVFDLTDPRFARFFLNEVWSAYNVADVVVISDSD